MAIEVRRFTNDAFGFPRGKRRRIIPVAIACIRITGNNSTGAMDKADPGSRNRNEFNFANRANSDGPSAHLYVASDGSGIEALAPNHFAAWSNGDVRSPSKTNPGVARVVAFTTKGFNANEAYWEEIECVGGSGFPITDAQIETCARRVARRAAASGLPISRETVHGHFEINGIDRQNDPAPKAVHETVMRRIVEQAKAFAANAAAEPHPGETMAANAGSVVLRFGGTTAITGDFVVNVPVARGRTSPRIEADNILSQRLKNGDHFRVGQTTETGSSAGGSRRWHGNDAGTVWMHSSVLRPS
jgi:hypothetical protein